MGNRACGNVRGSIRGCARSTPQWANTDVTRLGLYRISGRGCAMGFGESVARVPPGRTGCIALRVGIRIDSSIADFDSWHRARSSRWSGLGSGVAGVTHDARLYDSRRRKGCGVSSIQNQGMGERRPSHEGSAGRSQVCECVSWAAVPRSCVSVLTGRGGSHDSAPSGLETRRSSPVWPSTSEVRMDGVRLVRRADLWPLRNGDRAASCHAPKWVPQPPE
jgi:hypothetical protein